MESGDCVMVGGFTPAMVLDEGVRALTGGGGGGDGWTECFGSDDDLRFCPAVLFIVESGVVGSCLLYTSPSPRDGLLSRMPSSA